MSDWNHIFLLRRLRWPALLLLTGVIALLDQMGILTWGHAWPLYLILLGVLALAERAAMSTLPPYSDPYNPGYPYGYPPAAASADPAASPQPSPAWTQNAAAPEQTGLVPVSPFTSLASSAAPVEPQSNSDEKESHR